MQSKWIASPNFTHGRAGQDVHAVVIHVIEGSLASCDSWFATPASRVSAHYGIGLKGEVHQYVVEENAAWHAGRVDHPTWAGIRPGNPNLYTIGIEHEGTASSVWPEALYARSAQLVAEICLRYELPIDRAHIVGHREIYAKKTCPGKGDVDRIVKLARLYAMTLDELKDWQTQHGLAADGIIGPLSRAKWEAC